MKTTILLLASLLTSFWQAPPSTIYEFKVQDALGTDIELSQYSGQVLLVVNVANKCMHTPQYAELQELYDEFGEKGFTVLAFPSSNFSKEDKDAEAFKSTCTRKYAITFPVFSMVNVKGKQIHPLYAYLSQKEKNSALDAPVKMNFQKYLIGRDGKVIASFSPRTSVKDKKVRAALEAALKSEK